MRVAAPGPLWIAPTCQARSAHIQAPCRACPACLAGCRLPQLKGQSCGQRATSPFEICFLVYRHRPLLKPHSPSVPALPSPPFFQPQWPRTSPSVSRREHVRLSELRRFGFGLALSPRTCTTGCRPVLTIVEWIHPMNNGPGWFACFADSVSQRLCHTRGGRR